MLMPDSGLVYKNELKSLIVVKTIHAPVDLIYDSFTNFDKRMEWNEEIKEIILHGKA